MFNTINNQNRQKLRKTCGYRAMNIGSTRAIDNAFLGNFDVGKLNLLAPSGATYLSLNAFKIVQAPSGAASFFLTGIMPLPRSLITIDAHTILDRP
jgi:hypothetical protein